MCAKRGKNIGNRGLYMPFEAFESRNFTHFVPFPRFGTTGESLY